MKHFNSMCSVKKPKRLHTERTECAGISLLWSLCGSEDKDLFHVIPSSKFQTYLLLGIFYSLISSVSSIENENSNNERQSLNTASFQSLLIFLQGARKHKVYSLEEKIEPQKCLLRMNGVGRRRMINGKGKKEGK